MVKDFHIFPDHREISIGDDIVDNFVFVINGEKWRRIRSILKPTFTSGKMRKMFHLMNDCTDDVLEVLEERAKKGEDVDLKVLFGNYTLDVIGRCCFATKTNVYKDPNNEFVKQVRTLFKPRFITAIL